MQATDWDARYAAAEGRLFGDRPNEYLRMVVARSDFTARSALLPADGDGRNGAWLAGQGLSVSAVDISSEGTRRALACDRAVGVTVERYVADLAVWSPSDHGCWDLAAILYLQGPAALRRRTVMKSAEALPPGGWMMIEGFAKAEGVVRMGPDDPEKRWSIEELRQWLPSLEPLETMSGEIRLDEGPRHSGMAHALRYLARKPA